MPQAVASRRFSSEDERMPTVRKVSAKMTDADQEDIEKLKEFLREKGL